MADMHVDSRFLGWGVFFIVLGAVPLAVGQGLIDPATISGWWRLWPLILIGVGVGLILRRTPAHFLGGLIVAATLGLLFGSLIAGGTNGSAGFGCGSGRSGVALQPVSGGFGTEASVRTTPGLASVQIHLSLSANAGSIKLDPEGGCG